METEPYQKAIRKRKVWVEPLFAEGKLWHGMRRFRMRTLKKVNAEAPMIATGQNIKRLLSFGGSTPKKLAQAVALQPPDRPLPALAHRSFRDHRRKRRVVLRFSTSWFVYETNQRPGPTDPKTGCGHISKRVIETTFQEEHSALAHEILLSERGLRRYVQARAET
jgi:hypothetical protein